MVAGGIILLSVAVGMVAGGAVLLVVAVGMAVWAQVMSRRLKAMAQVETVACQDLAALRDAAAQAAGPGAFSLVCEVTGTTEPGDTGLLKAELSKVDCVWHRHVITRHYEDTRTDSKGNRTSTTNTETMADHTSAAPFRVRDASGTVLVDPVGARFDHAEEVVDRFEPHRGKGSFSVSLGGISLTGGGGTLGFEYKEWVLRPGQRVYLLGEASDRSGRLVVGRPASGPYVFSTRSEQELAHSFRTQRTVARIGVGVAGVAGLVLLVMGLLG
jgi:hypothetical protein